jgi:Mce-associated membrane protein
MSEETVLEVERNENVAAGESPRDGAASASGGEEATVGAPVPVARARRRFGIVEVVGLVVIIALAVALIISRVQLSNQSATNGDRAGALAAARTDAVDVATYSYLHLPRDFGRVEGESTPSFRRSFIKSSDNLSKVLVQYKATASAKVLKSAVESINGSNAVVLLFVNQSVANTTQQGVNTDDSRIEVTLVRSGDRWLLQNLKLL